MLSENNVMLYAKANNLRENNLTKDSNKPMTDRGQRERFWLASFEG